MSSSAIAYCSTSKPPLRTTPSPNLVTVTNPLPELDSILETKKKLTKITDKFDSVREYLHRQLGRSRWKVPKMRTENEGWMSKNLEEFQESENLQSKGFKMGFVCLLYEARTNPSRQIEAHQIWALYFWLNLRCRIQNIFETKASDLNVLLTHFPGTSPSRSASCNHHYVFNARAIRVLEVTTVRLFFSCNTRKHQIIGTTIKANH